MPRLVTLRDDSHGRADRAQAGLRDARRAGLGDRAAAEHAIIELTRTGVVSSSNPAAELLYGYLAVELTGHGVDVLCPPERRAVEAEILRQIIAEGADRAVRGETGSAKTGR